MKPSSRQLRLDADQQTFNWPLFMVLLHSILLFRLIQIFGVLAGDRCIGHSHYWLSDNMLGWSMYDTLNTVFLLCLLWSLVDVTLYLLSQAPRKTHLLLLSVGMAATAVICIRVTVELEQMSPLIASIQENIQACHYGT